MIMRTRVVLPILFLGSIHEINYSSYHYTYDASMEFFGQSAPCMANQWNVYVDFNVKMCKGKFVYIVNVMA